MYFKSRDGTRDEKIKDSYVSEMLLIFRILENSNASGGRSKKYLTVECQIGSRHIWRKQGFLHVRGIWHLQNYRSFKYLWQNYKLDVWICQMGRWIRRRDDKGFLYVRVISILQNYIKYKCHWRNFKEISDWLRDDTFDEKKDFYRS